MLLSLLIFLICIGIDMMSRLVTQNKQVKSLNSVNFVTLTNNGYLDYTLNCLKSLELIDFQKPLHCYAIDQECHNILQLKGYNSTCLKLTNVSSKFEIWDSKNIPKIYFQKFTIIYKNLLENKFVCFTDGDIVFLDKKFMNYCLDYIQDNDMVIQNDSLSNNDHTNLCSGFMFIKSNKKTIDLFNPKNVEEDVKDKWGDQIHVNKIKSKLKYRTLPLHLFPNGRYYYQSKNPLHFVNLIFNCKPMMIHFNWVIGHEKRNKMKKYNKWYLRMVDILKSEIKLIEWQRINKDLNDIIVQNSPTDESDS